MVRFDGRLAATWAWAAIVSASLISFGIAAEKSAKKDIVDTAVAAGSFKTLVKAVQAAELVDALKGKGPLTVLAPSDEAFAKVPKETLEGLLKDKEKLAAVLKYHVISGHVAAADVAKLQSAKTLQGGTLAISTKDGVKFNDSKVVKADIHCSNGIIHVIDTVLIPQ